MTNRSNACFSSTSSILEQYCLLTLLKILHKHTVMLYLIKGDGSKHMLGNMPGNVQGTFNAVVYGVMKSCYFFFINLAKSMHKSVIINIIHIF